MIKKLFTLQSQKLDQYISYVSSTPFAEGATRNEIVKFAKQYLVSDLIKAISTKITRENTGTMIYHRSIIELEWQDVEQDGHTYFWVNATVSVEDGKPNAITD